MLLDGTRYAERRRSRRSITERHWLLLLQGGEILKRRKERQRGREVSLIGTAQRRRHQHEVRYMEFDDQVKSFTRDDRSGRENSEVKHRIPRSTTRPFSSDDFR